MKLVHKMDGLNFTATKDLWLPLMPANINREPEKKMHYGGTTPLVANSAKSFLLCFLSENKNTRRLYSQTKGPLRQQDL